MRWVMGVIFAPLITIGLHLITDSWVFALSVGTWFLIFWFARPLIERAKNASSSEKKR